MAKMNPIEKLFSLHGKETLMAGAGKGGSVHRRGTLRPT